MQIQTSSSAEEIVDERVDLLLFKEKALPACRSGLHNRMHRNAAMHEATSTTVYLLLEELGEAQYGRTQPDGMIVHWVNR